MDNTISTPALQNPVDLGATFVVHSTTKYICGNASSLGGMICGPSEIVEGIRQNGLRYLGPSMSPFNAWINLCGLESLLLRMDKHCSNAMAVANFLESHPKVESVNYPGYHQILIIVFRKWTASKDSVRWCPSSSKVHMMKRLNLLIRLNCWRMPRIWVLPRVSLHIRHLLSNHSKVI